MINMNAQPDSISTTIAMVQSWEDRQMEAQAYPVEEEEAYLAEEVPAYREAGGQACQAAEAQGCPKAEVQVCQAAEVQTYLREEVLMCQLEQAHGYWWVWEYWSA
jgi:hypothetical protein